MSTSPDPTKLLAQVRAGNRRAGDALLPLVYEELRDLAQGYLRREKPGHTLQATALVHEAYLRLVDQTRVDWQGRTHFKAVAALAMRRLLVDHARSRNRKKRGRDWRRVTLHDALLLSDTKTPPPAVLHEALEKMRCLDERQYRVVELRVFGGLSNNEIAGFLEVSVRTVERDWKMGQTWLRRELSTGARD